jgi:hypothetical protein
MRVRLPVERPTLLEFYYYAPYRLFPASYKYTLPFILFSYGRVIYCEISCYDYVDYT